MSVVLYDRDSDLLINVHHLMDSICSWFAIVAEEFSVMRYFDTIVLVAFQLGYHGMLGLRVSFLTKFDR